MRGYTLVEVLVALSLFSFALIGMGAAENILIRQSKNIAIFFYATEELENLSEILLLPYDNKNLLTAWRSSLDQELKKHQVILEDSKLVLSWGDNKSEGCKVLMVGHNGCVYKKIPRIIID